MLTAFMIFFTSDQVIMQLKIKTGGLFQIPFDWLQLFLALICVVHSCCQLKKFK